MKELDMVRLTKAAGNVPAGMIGTIVHVYPGAKAFEVEFTVGGESDSHWHTTLLLEPGDLEPAQGSR